MKDTNFFKVPKKLIRDEDFKKLSLSSKILIFYLLSLYNTFKNKKWIEQKPQKLSEETGFSKTTLWRCKTEIQILGIKFKKINRNYNFDLTKFFEKFIGKRDSI